MDELESASRMMERKVLTQPFSTAGPMCVTAASVRLLRLPAKKIVGGNQVLKEIKRTDLLRIRFFTGGIGLCERSMEDYESLGRWKTKKGAQTKLCGFSPNCSKF